MKEIEHIIVIELPDSLDDITYDEACDSNGLWQKDPNYGKYGITSMFEANRFNYLDWKDTVYLSNFKKWLIETYGDKIMQYNYFMIISEQKE